MDARPGDRPHPDRLAPRSSPRRVTPRPQDQSLALGPVQRPAARRWVRPGSRSGPSSPPRRRPPRSTIGAGAEMTPGTGPVPVEGLVSGPTMQSAVRPRPQRGPPSLCTGPSAPPPTPPWGRGATGVGFPKAIRPGPDMPEGLTSGPLARSAARPRLGGASPEPRILGSPAFHRVLRGGGKAAPPWRRGRHGKSGGRSGLAFCLSLPGGPPTGDPGLGVPKFFGDLSPLFRDCWSGVRHLTTGHTVLPNARNTGKTRY